MSDRTTRELSAEAVAELNPPEARGILFVISSPSGGGKGTLIRRVRRRVPRLGYSVSWTTRAPRAGEIEGVHYNFVTPAEFHAATSGGEFLEWAYVHENFYGTSRTNVERELAAGRDVILEIDVQGAASVKRAGIDSVSIFILPPSFEVLRARLTARNTEMVEQLAVRLGNARDEVEQYREFDYVILNDEIERAAGQLAAVVHAERARRHRQQPLAQRVLATFPPPAGGAAGDGSLRPHRTHQIDGRARRPAETRPGFIRPRLRGQSPRPRAPPGRSSRRRRARPRAPHARS
ncbi:MAG: guanylate kinase [Acidobacteria bacterium]|nr:guanylate kinase [Acidobacteriota bacterium]